MQKNVKEREQSLPPKERYLLRLKEFSSFYLMLVTVCAVTYVAAIAIAIILNLLIGVALAIFTAIIYFFFSTQEPKRYLGISCKLCAGRIHITHLEAAYGDTAYVPSRLMWADVTKIDDGALASDENASISSLYLPSSIELIGKDIFGNNPTRPVIYYEGTLEEWEKISTQTDLSKLLVVPLSTMPVLRKNDDGTDTEVTE